MNAWLSKNILPDTGATAVSASTTAGVVSKEFPITAKGALNMVIAVTATSATVTTAISAILQTKVSGIDAWVSAKSVSITADGNFYIKLQTTVSGDQTHLPLGDVGRVVVTTGADDVVTISKVVHVQEN